MNRVIPSGSGWRVLDSRGRPVANIVFTTRQSAEDCLDGTIRVEWSAAELCGVGS